MKRMEKELKMIKIDKKSRRRVKANID